jgi:hypothetical protein
MEYICSFTVKAAYSAFLDDKTGCYILSFDEFKVIEFDKRLGFSAKIIDDSEIEFKEPRTKNE